MKMLKLFFIKFICLLKELGIYNFPVGIRLRHGKVLQKLATRVAGELAKKAKNKRYTSLFTTH